jgi:hypothetical protein
MTTTIAAPAVPVEHDLGSGGIVDVESLDVEIRVRGIEGALARVRLTAGDLAEEFRVEREPGRLTIRPIKRWSFKRRLVGPLELEVPRDAQVLAESASGSVLGLDLLAGGRFRSAAGDIDLAGPGSEVDASSVSGGVRVRAAEPVALKLKTASGRIDVVAHAATSIDAHSVSGSIDLASRLTGDGPYSLHSVSGTLTIATDGVIRLMASTVSGSVRSELPQAQVVGRGRTLALGGDGPVVGARTVSGDIRVVPLPSELATAPAPAVRTLTAAEPRAGDPAPPTGDAPAPPADDDPRMAALRALERGDIDVAEASRRLRALETADV